MVYYIVHSVVLILFSSLNKVFGESESYKAKGQSAAPASCRLLYKKKDTKRNSENGCEIFLAILCFCYYYYYYYYYYYCGDIFSVDHSMVCKKGGFIIQRHNELRDLEADLLSMVCKDVEIEPQLQDVTGEELSSGSNLAKEARLDIHARGFWEKHQSAFFDIRVCHSNAESYKQMEPKQIYRLHENEKKRSYSRRVLDIEHGSFTPLVFTSTGGMGPECLRFHSRLAELIADKNGEHYSRTISWIRARTSFALLRSALICLRESRTIKRRKMDLTNADIDIQNSEAAIL